MNENIFFSMHISKNFEKNEHQIVAFHSKSTNLYQFIKNFKTIAQTMLSLDQFFINTHETQITRTYSLDYFMTNIVQIDMSSSQITKKKHNWKQIEKNFCKSEKWEIDEKNDEKYYWFDKKIKKKKKTKSTKTRESDFSKIDHWELRENLNKKIKKEITF